MAINFRKIIDGIRIIPKAVSTASEKGDLEVDNATGKLNYHNGSSLSPVVTETQGASQLIVSANSTSDAVRITQTGSGNALLVEDSANPDATPFVIDSSGNVGIGTSSPQKQLDISAISDATIRLSSTKNDSSWTTEKFGSLEWYSADQSGNASLRASIDSIPTAGGLGDKGQLLFNVKTGTSTTLAEAMRIDSSGYIGVGTTSPQRPLHVSFSSSGNPWLRVENPSSTGTTAASGWEFYTHNGTASSQQGAVFSTANSWTFGGYGANSTSLLGIGTGGTNVVASNAAGVIKFLTGGESVTNERLRIDASGRVLVGTTSARNIGTSLLSSSLQVEGINTNSSSILAYSNDSTGFFNGGILAFGRSRGAAIGAVTAAQNGDSLGRIQFMGADGTSGGVTSAYIVGQVDGTVSTNVMPGALTFWTTPAASNAPIERLRIDSAGRILAGGTAIPGTGSIVSVQSSVDTVEGTVLEIRNNNTGISANNTLGALKFYNSDSTTNAAGYSGIIRLGFIDAGLTPYMGFHVGVPSGGGAQERLRIDSSGNLLVNTTAARSLLGANNHIPNIQLETVGNTNNRGLSLTQNNAGIASSVIYFNKTRGTTAGSFTAVTSGDILGVILFNGADGSAILEGSSIVSTVEGTVSTGTVPGRLQFFTTNSSGVSTERLRINSDGRVLVGTTSATNNIRNNAKLAVVSVGAISGNQGGAQFTHYSGANTTLAPILDFATSNGTTDGSMTAVGSSQFLGQIAFRGSDGTSFSTASILRGESDGAVSTGVVPGRFSIHTADSLGATQERLRIDSAGNVGIGTTSPHTRLHTSGPIATAVTSNGATSYNILATDSTVLLTATTGTITATLPTAVGITGRQYVIKRTGTGATSYTVNTTSSQTIDGAATYTLAAQYATVTVQSDGANWVIISKF